MTCDNASNNDAMIQELGRVVPSFAGFAGHTRCFLHIVNLVAKSLIRQFDAKTAIEGDTELAEWAKELTDEQDEFQKGYRNDDNSNEAGDDEEDGIVDETIDLTDDEKNELERSTRPVKLALVKVSWIARHTNFSECPISSVNWPTRSLTRRPKTCRCGRKS